MSTMDDLVTSIIESGLSIEELIRTIDNHKEKNSILIDYRGKLSWSIYQCLCKSYTQGCSIYVRDSSSIEIESNVGHEDMSMILPSFKVGKCSVIYTIDDASDIMSEVVQIDNLMTISSLNFYIEKICIDRNE